MISAGRVLIMPKGEYDASTTYSMLDLVSYNGSSYVAKRSTTGNLPTNTTYWQLSAYGGSAANMAANFAPIETTEYATRAYSQGDYLVNKDGQFCKVIVAIAIGDEINSTNTATTSVEEVIEDLTSYVDELDAEDAKITGKTAIAGQTDLHTLGIGNYYKTNTSVYVTNAPTGIDSVPTAKFRLTVENTNNAVSDSTKILTLRTFDGKTYTQAYDGASWSDWKLLGDNADVPTYIGATSVAAGVKGLVPAASAGDNDKFFKGDGTFEALGTAAYKDSTDTITEDSTDLIESGAVYSLSESITTLGNNDDAILNVLGAKNLQGGTFTSSVHNGVTFTANTNTGIITASGSVESGKTYAGVFGSSFILKAGTYKLNGSPSPVNENGSYLDILDASNNQLAKSINGSDVTFTLAVDTTIYCRCLVLPIDGNVNLTYKPMIRPASVADNTYVPYAMTNRELTCPQYVGVILNPGSNGWIIGFPLPNNARTATITRISPLGITSLTGLNITVTLGKGADDGVCVGYVSSDTTPTGASETLKSLATKYSTLAVVRVTY